MVVQNGSSAILSVAHNIHFTVCHEFLCTLISKLKNLITLQRRLVCVGVL